MIILLKTLPLFFGVVEEIFCRLFDDDDGAKEEEVEQNDDAVAFVVVDIAFVVWLLGTRI